MRLDVHPDFGYLGPSPQFLRAAKFGLTALVVGAALGAASVFALGGRLGHAVESPLAITQTEDATAARGPEFAGTRGISAIASPQSTPCTQQTSPNVERGCQTGRRWHHLRVMASEVQAQVESTEVAKPTAEPTKPATPAVEPVKKYKSAHKRSRNRDNEFEGTRAFAADRADRAWRRSYRGYAPRLGYWLDDRPLRRW